MFYHIIIRLILNIFLKTLYVLEKKPPNLVAKNLVLYLTDYNQPTVVYKMGFAPNRQLAIIWTKDDLVYRHIYSSASFDEVTHWILAEVVLTFEV